MEGREGEGVGHKTPGRAWALARAPVGCAHLEAHLSVKPTPKIPVNRETIRNNPRSKVPPLQAYIDTENQSGARSDNLPEGEIITGGHLHHPGSHHDEEGVAYSWG